MFGALVEGAGYGDTAMQFCPDNEFATGFNLMYGAHINGAGLICAPLPPAPKVIPPKPGTVVLAPTKTGPVLVSEYAFGGVWHTLASNNNRIDVTLYLPQDPGPYVRPLMIPVQGTLRTANGAADISGTISGYIQAGTRTFIYTYVLPGAAETGQGQLILSADGQSITGQGVLKVGQTADPMTWRGVRAK